MRSFLGLLGSDSLSQTGLLLDSRIKLDGSSSVSQELRVHSSKTDVLLLLRLLDSVSVSLADLVLVGVVLALGHCISFGKVYNILFNCFEIQIVLPSY